MINESKQSKQGPIHKMSYRLDKGAYDFCIESIGEVVKDKSTGGQYDQFCILESLLWLWAEGLDWICTRLVIGIMTRIVILKEMR